MTRIGIVCRGRDRQLLKVLDKGSEILLFLAAAGKYVGAPFAGREILEQRYTVHETKHSVRNINEIKQTIRLEDDGLVETILDAKGPKSGKIQLIYVRGCPSLELPRYDMNAKRADIVGSIGDYNPEKRTLLYAVFISSVDGPERIASHSRYNQNVFDFDRFRLYIISTLVCFPSYWDGRLFHLTSNVMRYNKEKIPGKILDGVEGFDPKGARSIVLNMFDAMFETISKLPEGGYPEDLVEISSKVGFGFWCDTEWDKRIERVARRTYRARALREKARFIRR